MILHKKFFYPKFLTLSTPINAMQQSNQLYLSPYAYLTYVFPTKKKIIMVTHFLLSTM